MRAVVGQHRVDLVGHGGGKGPEEVAGDTPRRLLMQLDKGELGGPVDRHEKVELALFGSHLGNIDVEIANRISLELGASGLSPSTSGSREMPWRWRHRCSDDRVGAGSYAWSA